jgi:hypothetical protein
MSNDSCSAPITAFQRLIFDGDRNDLPRIIIFNSFGSNLKEEARNKTSEFRGGVSAYEWQWARCFVKRTTRNLMTINAFVLTGMPTITNKPHRGFRPLVSGHWLQLVLMQSVWIP